MPTVGPYVFSATDASRTFSNLGMWWDHLTAGIDASAATPIGERLASTLAAGLGAAFAPGSDLSDALGDLGRAAALHVSGRENEPHAVALLAEAWHSMRSAMTALRESGAICTTGSGTVARINVSDGGVPKRAVNHAEIGFRGVAGDRQGSRQHHGRPWQALCLWSSEVIDEFARQGHPLAPGCAGENLTVASIDWSTMRPGMLLRIGTVLAETSSWAIPCRHNAQWFTDGDFNRMSHERGPVARIYATVIEPGEVQTGDAVHVVASTNP